MKKIFKKILAMALCCAMLVPMGALGASAATAKETETDCGGKCHRGETTRKKAKKISSRYYGSDILHS